MINEARLWSSEEFRAFLKWLDSDPERAAESYALLLKRLRYFFEGWRDAAPHAEELADKSIDRAMKRFVEDPEIGSRDPAKYVLAVARYILKEFRKIPHTVELAEDPPDSRIGPDLETEHRLECLNKCLSKLPPEEYDLLKRYYLYDQQDRIHARREAAMAAGKSSGAIRVRVFRLCRSLQPCIQKCLKRHEM